MSTRICFEQTRHIQNKSNSAITGNRRTGHARGALQQVIEWLDHHLFLTNQLSTTNPIC